MNKYNRGFSLIELAVSVIIIGLLVGGIAGGSKLLTQAELRGMISQMDQYKADYNAFKLEYNAVAGDMKDASVFFANCAIGGSGNNKCDGNGDGFITFNMANFFDGANRGDELVKFFRHLNLSGINTDAGKTIISNYSAFSNTGSVSEGYFPKGRLSGSTIVVSSVDAGNTGDSASAPGTLARQATANAELFSNFPFNSTVVFTMKGDSGSLFNGAMPALLAHNIDRKMDDGDSSAGIATGANTGKVRTINDNTGSNACVATNTYNIATIQSTCVVQSLIK
jgi:prepilin-type N-terminal cleavage/methylation domain-containing protein